MLDNEGDNVTVYAWHDLGSGYAQIGSYLCEDCSTSTVVNFTQPYLCSQKGAGKAFKFNATDTEGNSFETSSGTFTIDEDNVIIEYFFTTIFKDT